MRIESITLRAGVDKSGNREAVSEFTLTPGMTLSIVGPTGSGKSELLSDIEQLACGDTLSGRNVLVNGELLLTPQGNLVATLSQKTHFVMDASVEEFLQRHAASKGMSDIGQRRALAARVLAVANTLCGEPILPGMSLQVLSGGQSRALMIADVSLVSDTPIVLIDEIENAGIDKFKALGVLAGQVKIVIIATHDPVLMLAGEARLVMGNGGMRALLHITPEEQEALAHLARLDSALLKARNILREGNRCVRETLTLQEQSS